MWVWWGSGANYTYIMPHGHNMNGDNMDTRGITRREECSIGICQLKLSLIVAEINIYNSDSPQNTAERDLTSDIWHTTTDNSNWQVFRVQSESLVLQTHALMMTNWAHCGSQILWRQFSEIAPLTIELKLHRKEVLWTLGWWIITKLML